MRLPTLADVHAARERISPWIRRTPLEPSPAALPGTEVLLKLEAWQVSGSFKPRISFAKLLSLPEDQRALGAVASTAGGHGIGLSHAARALGVPCDIHLPASADPFKVDLIRRNGAVIHVHGSVPEARAAAQRQAREEGRTFVSAYNDPVIISGGGGTVGLELLEDAPDPDLVIVGMGGGGMAAGIGLAMKESGSRTQVWGVQPASAPVLATWLESGRVVEVDARPSIAEGLGAGIETDSITFPLCQRYVDRTLLVTDEEIREAMRFLLREHQLVVEPSGAAPLAALWKAKPEGFRRIALVLTGRVVGMSRYLALIAEG